MRLSAIFIHANYRLECANVFLPSDIFGLLMNLVHPPGMAFHNQIVDLIYKLIFFGLKTLDFSHIPYFALVFAAQSLVLEYYNEHVKLQKMLEFLLYRFLVFFVIENMGLEFDTLFEASQLQNENSFNLNNQIKSSSISTVFILRSHINLELLLSKINQHTSKVLNQICFCRAKISDELLKMKVMDRMRSQTSVQKEELKKRFLKIEELRERSVFRLLKLLPKSDLIAQNVESYNDSKQFTQNLFGI